MHLYLLSHAMPYMTYMEYRISEALGAISDPKISGSGTKISGIYPIFRTSVGSL